MVVTWEFDGTDDYISTSVIQTRLSFPANISLEVWIPVNGVYSLP